METHPSGGSVGKPGPQDELSDYEKVRLLNIQTRHAELKEAGFYDDLKAAKRDVLHPGTSAKLDDVKKPPRGKLRDAAKQETLPPPRKSTRERKPVLYNVDEDDESPGIPRKRRVSKKKAEEEDSYDPQKDEPTPDPSPAKKPRKSLRKKEVVNYAEDVEDQIPATDSFIWCSVCNDQKYNGCELHPPRFATLEEFQLKVDKSAVAKNAGEGVFNRGDVIKEGTVFGPYVGKYHSKSSYQVKMKAGEESGNAWEIKDPDGLKIIGYVDPGRSVDPKVHWMTKINCATKTYAQNMVGFQLHGQIYYRVTQDIVNGAELLVYYGQEYAKELGINVAKLDYFKGKEDHKDEGWKCPGCNTLFSSEHSLFVHQDTHSICSRKFAQHNRQLVCKGCKEVFKNGKVLMDHQIVCFPKCFRRELTGVTNKCEICRKVFKSSRNMKVHMTTVHGKMKDFKCPTCGKAFRMKAHLTKHIKTVHQMSRSHSCPDCGQSFTEAGNMKRHREALHLGIRYPCTWTPPPGDFEEFTFSCNKTFTLKRNLDAHIKKVHTWNFRHECQICLAKDVWWGCMSSTAFKSHMKSKHPEEYQAEQEAFNSKHPHVCKFSKCRKRFETEVERVRHQEKLH